MWAILASMLRTPTAANTAIRQRPSALLGLAALAVVLSACGLGDLGSENTSPSSLRLEFENTTDEYLYLVRGFGDDTEAALLEYELLAIPPDSTYEVGAGGDPRSTNDGCFTNEQFWIVRSRNNIEYWRSWEEQPKPVLDDLEVLRHLDATTCLEPGAHNIRFP